jgi:hypothetical protein
MIKTLLYPTVVVAFSLDLIDRQLFGGVTMLKYQVQQRTALVQFK